jgi:hypothetical protein
LALPSRSAPSLGFWVEAGTAEFELESLLRRLVESRLASVAFFAASVGVLSGSIGLAQCFSRRFRPPSAVRLIAVYMNSGSPFVQRPSNNARPVLSWRHRASMSDGAISSKPSNFDVVLRTDREPRRMIANVFAFRKNHRTASPMPAVSPVPKWPTLPDITIPPPRGGERYSRARGARKYSGARCSSAARALRASDWFLLYLNAMCRRPAMRA